MVFRYKWLLIGGLGLILLVTSIFIYGKVNKPPDPNLEKLMHSVPHTTAKQTNPPEAPTQKAQSKVDNTMIMVDIKGQVKHPGVFQLTSNDRVLDAIEKAGGLTASAEQRSLNLAQKLTDEMVIYVPEKGEKPFISSTPTPSSTTATSEQTASSPLVHVNSASLDQLQLLPGIGPSKAQAILKYREQHGPFQKVDDLTNVTGIGDKSLEKMKNQIDLN